MRDERGVVTRCLVALEEHAQNLDTLADLLDSWAVQSRRGGWSTHQVEANEREANNARRLAAKLRGTLTTLRGEFGS